MVLGKTEHWDEGRTGDEEKTEKHFMYIFDEWDRAERFWAGSYLIYLFPYVILLQSPDSFSLYHTQHFFEVLHFTFFIAGLYTASFTVIIDFIVT